MSGSKQKIRIRAGAIIKLRGMPFELTEDICVMGRLENLDSVNSYNAPGDGERVESVLATPWEQPQDADSE